MMNNLLSQLKSGNKETIFFGVLGLVVALLLYAKSKSNAVSSGASNSDPTVASGSTTTTGTTTATGMDPVAAALQLGELQLQTQQNIAQTQAEYGGSLTFSSTNQFNDSANANSSSTQTSSHSGGGLLSIIGLGGLGGSSSGSNGNNSSQSANFQDTGTVAQTISGSGLTTDEITNILNQIPGLEQTQNNNALSLQTQGGKVINSVAN